MTKLNLGAGPVREPDEIGVDLDPGASGCDVAATLLALPFRDGSIAQARLSHVLEHFPYRMAPTVLLEVARVLAPGGRVIVGVPDMVATCRAWLEADALAPPASLSGKAIVTRHMFGSQAHDGQEHLSCFDAETLADLLRCCGFTQIDVHEDTERGDLIETLIATAVKASACSSPGSGSPASSASALATDRARTPLREGRSPSTEVGRPPEPVASRRARSG